MLLRTEATTFAVLYKLKLKKISPIFASFGTLYRICIKNSNINIVLAVAQKNQF